MRFRWNRDAPAAGRAHGALNRARLATLARRVCVCVARCVPVWRLARARAPGAPVSATATTVPLSSFLGVCVHMCVDAGLCLYILFLHPAACQPRVCARVYVLMRVYVRERETHTTYTDSARVWSLSLAYIVVSRINIL